MEAGRGGTEREAKGGEMGGSFKTNREKKTKERGIYIYMYIDR